MNTEIKFYVPFEGFYYSVYDSLIDSIIEMEIEEGYLPEDSNVDYLKIHESVSVEIFDKIVELFNDEYDLFNSNDYFKYHGLSSSKYYNYSTDKFMAVCSYEVYLTIYNKFISNENFINWLNENSKPTPNFWFFYEGIDEVKKDPSIFLEYLFKWFTLVEHRDEVIDETCENLNEIIYNNLEVII